MINHNATLEYRIPQFSNCCRYDTPAPDLTFTDHPVFASIGNQFIRNCWLIFLTIATLTVWCGAASAQSGETPEYISVLTDYEVKRLDAVDPGSAGGVSMSDIVPAEWLSGDPGVTGLRAVIVAWNGGGKGVGSKLIVHGGGHNDSANNGTYVYDFSGTGNPTGWVSQPAISAIADVVPNGATYADGLPVSVHTYDGLVHASHNDHLYRFGGSRFQNGFMSTAAFKYDVRSRNWTRLPDYPGSSGGAKTLYDAATRKIFVTMNDSLEGYFFRSSNDTWSTAKPYGGDGFPYNSTGAWDASRNRGIIVGDGETSVVSIDFQNETVDVSPFSPEGDTGIYDQSGVSVVYDQTLDTYWIFGGSTSSPGWSAIYQLNANGPPWSTKAYPLSGTPVERAAGMLGSWGRFVFMNRWRAIGLVASEASPAFVIRLPGEIPPAPNPPEELDAR